MNGLGMRISFISNAKRRVKRNRFFPILKSEILCGELDRIIRMICFHIDPEALRLRVIR